jgi:hypothetical protein
MLNWKYTPDLDGALIKQRLEFLTVSFNESGMETKVQEISNDSRTYSFDFIGTVGIRLVAVTESGEIAAFLQLEPDPSSVNYHMEATVHNTGYLMLGGDVSYPQYYPDLGYPITTTPGGGCQSSSVNIATSRTIKFTTCFAAYDGIVDYNSESRTRSNYDYVLNSLESLLPNDNLFRALTFDFFEKQNASNEYHRKYPTTVGYFGMKQGSKYPPVLYDPYGESLNQNKFTNVILFGGALVADGTTEEYKTDDGSNTTSYNVESIQPVFIAVTLFFPDRFRGTNIQFTISDIQIGNIKQGLISTVTYNNISNETGVNCPGAWNWQVNGTPSDFIRGYIKEAVMGSEITFMNGSMAHVFVTVTELNFRLPFYPDDRLDQFVSSNVKAAKKSEHKNIEKAKGIMEVKPLFKPLEKKSK